MPKIFALLLAAFTVAAYPVIAQVTDRASPLEADVAALPNDAADNAVANRTTPGTENMADDPDADEHRHHGRDHNSSEESPRETGEPPAG